MVCKTCYGNPLSIKRNMKIGGTPSIEVLNPATNLIMAVKHIVEYYNQVCDQYLLLQEELKDFQKEVENGLVEPERIETLKQVIEPVKNNYMTLSWIMYLLNQPQRDSKERAYQKRMKTFTEKLDKKFSKEGILLENEETISSIGKV